MGVLSDSIKVTDFVSESCPYAPVLEEQAVLGDGEQLERVTAHLAEYAQSVEKGDETCKYIFDGQCGLARFTIAKAIELTEVEKP